MRPEFATVLLAAGVSRRMGAVNKLLLPIDGVAMVRHMTRVYQEATGARVLVVTGHDAANVEQALEGTGADTIRNPDFAQGQQTSVALGLRSIEGAHAILIGLCDQPFLTASDLKDLMTSHLASGGSKLTIPVQGNKRGNPIVVPAGLRKRLLDDPKHPGCRQFIRIHQRHVQPIRVSTSGFFADIDTPEQYAALANFPLEAS